ncbi:ribbon-helix-helix protein, CopG family [Knoellia sp. LjRoot47]|uniref:ribbon-helix-helix protein, CopG family n=1 Tax=Knoellia sp. LjRoot47 TaxID=3342330 RepID=UPI003ECECC69
MATTKKKASAGRDGAPKVRQTILRLPEDLAAQVDDIAETTGASRNAVIAAAVEHALAGNLAWTAGVQDGRRTRWERDKADRP